MTHSPESAPDPHPFILVDDPDATDAARVGVKAATLAELRLAGFPVPPGVTVPVGSFDPADGGLRSSAAELLRDVVSSSLGPGPYAVRSSGSSEDGAEASFAGQFDTLLDVEFADLGDAVVRCHHSGRSARVTAYAGRRRIDLAVLIQPMVAAEAAGVAFTRDPVNGAHRVIVEAIAGSGEHLVSGSTTPQRWTIDPDPSTPPAVSGPAEPDAADGPLDAGRAEVIAELARRVAAYRGNPQDIEWAWADGSAWLLQARPITVVGAPDDSPSAAPDAPRGERIPIPVSVPPGDWVRDDFHEPVPLSPFGRILLTEQILRVFPRIFEEWGVLLDRADVRRIGGWLYMRMVPLGAPRPRAGRRPVAAPPRWLLRVLLRTHPVVRRRIRTAERVLAEDRAAEITRRWVEEWRPEHIADLRRVPDLVALSDAELRSELEHRIRVIGHPAHVAVMMAYVIPMYELHLACRDLLGWDTSEMLHLLAGLSTTTTLPTRAMAPLVEHARSRPDLLGLLDAADESTLPRLRAAAPDFADAVDSYLAEYGHRVLRYEVIDPTLAEAPHLLLHLIAQQVQSGFDAIRSERDAAARRGAALARARSGLAARASEGDRIRFERALARAAEAYPLWEDRVLWTFGAQAARLRYCALEIGARLARRGQLAEPADVFFLEASDADAALADGLDRSDRVRLHRGQRNWAIVHPGPAAYGTPPPEPPFGLLPPAARLVNEALLWAVSPTGQFFGDRAGSPAADALVTGAPASAGRHTGTVRVVHGEDEFDQVRSGDVVVCRVTSPAWSIVLPTMGALVTDVGGVLSHPAIIAREYGVPCVVGTRDGTSKLTSGQRVTVDGSSGVVSAA